MPVSCLLYSVLHLSPLSFSLQPFTFCLIPVPLFTFHTLQIKDLEKEIYVEEGKTLKVGLFKGRTERTSAAGRDSLTEA